ncbi:MAG: DUF2997 domain-containing protein [Methanoregula sp.]|nr:DUF2997 domain-containing protein [Methanoregula sp.]
MAMQELEITIDNEGRVLVHVTGVKGEECLALTKALENAVGDVQERSFSSDYYEQPVEVSQYQKTGLR